MCFEILAPLLGAVVSGVGSAMNQSAQRKQAEAQAKARNDELNKTFAKNDQLAKEARDRYQAVEDQTKPAQLEQQQAEATQERDQTLANSLVDTPTETMAAPLAGSAPAVVKSEIAQRMLDTVDQGKKSAKALAKVGGYGSALFNQGIENQAAGRDIGVKTGFVAQNLSTLPYQQDFAEYKAYKPVSPLGSILMGLGNVAGSFTGSRSGMPKTNLYS